MSSVPVQPCSRMIPWWKRAPAALLQACFRRSGRLRRLADVAHGLAHPLSDYERYYRAYMGELFDVVAATDPRDASLRDYNARHRGERQAQSRGPRTLAIVLPDITGSTSGGQRTVFRIARHWLDRGHRVHLYINLFSYTRDPDRMRAYIREHYGDERGLEVHLDTRAIGESDILMATGWETAYTVFRQPNTRFKAYLVQDYEPWFSPMSAPALFAENTYRMNLFGCFSSPWLARMGREQFGMDGLQFHYGYDEAHYGPAPATPRDPDLVAVYLRPTTARRGFELMKYALRRLKEQRPRTRIAIFGSSERIDGLGFEAEQLGALDDRCLAGLYRRAAVVTVASLTNYSIIPVEAMACGALVVDVDRPSVASIFTHGEDILLAPVHPQAIAETLRAALDDATLRSRITTEAGARLARFRWPEILAGLERDLLDAYCA